jgi:hypothetical protein
LEHGRLDVPHSVALADFAITCGLSGGQIGAIARIGKTAYVANACARFAEVVHTRTLARRGAPDALACAIAHLARSTIEVLGFRGIRRHAIRANVLRARIAVIWQIRIVIDRRRAQFAIANHFFAIFCGLENWTRQCAHCLVGDLALVGDATTLFALGLSNTDAMIRRGTFDACPFAVANLDVAWRASRRIGDVVVLGHSIRADVECARIVVVEHVGIVIDLDVRAILASMQLTIACDRRHARRR